MSKVEQVDRDAAKALLLRLGAGNFQEGRWIEIAAEAFAAHRGATSSSSPVCNGATCFDYEGGKHHSIDCALSDEGTR